MLKVLFSAALAVLTILVFGLFASSSSSSVSVRAWAYAREYNNRDVVTYRGQAYLATRNVSADDAPSKNSGAWRQITNYSNPRAFRSDSAYVAGDIVRYEDRVYVATGSTGNTTPRQNQRGTWTLVSNYAPISGPIAKLPPHPGEAGRATILGIDSDGDGVRDDIQIEITRLIPDDPQKRAAAMSAVKINQELLAAFLKDTTQTFEQLRPYFMASAARAKYWVDNKVYESISDARYNALLYNTRERFNMLRKIDRLANGQAFPSFESLPIDVQEKYNRMFQEVYEREKERQK